MSAGYRGVVIRSDRPGWVDNHCHLDGEQDPRSAVADARAAGVRELVTVGTDVARSAACIQLAEHIEHLWATAGVHPHDATQGTDELADLVDRTLERGDHRLVAIGECGLDYHYDHSPRDVQRRAFAAQIALAHRCGLPLVIHTREAWDDTFDLLEQVGMPERTVFHCFTGGPVEAERALDMGAFLSVSGIVTFKKSEGLRAIVKDVPLDRILVETDAPYLAPVPFRGKRNEPAYVAHTAACVAEVKGVDAAELARISTENFFRLFARADTARQAAA